MQTEVFVFGSSVGVATALLCFCMRQRAVASIQIYFVLPSFKAIKGAPRPYSPGLGVWGSGAVGPKGPLDRRVCSMRRRGVVVSALVGFG